jgi:hypothetical protein
MRPSLLISALSRSGRAGVGLDLWWAGTPGWTRRRARPRDGSGAAPRAGDRVPDARIARGERVCCLGKALAARLPSAAVRSPRDWGARQLVAVGRCCASTLAVHHLACDARRGQGMTSTASGRGAGYERDGAVHHPARRSHRIPLWWHGLGRPPHHLAHWLPNPHTRSSLNNQLQRTIQASSTAHHSTKHATAQPPVITDGRHRPALLSTHLIRGEQCAKAPAGDRSVSLQLLNRGGRQPLAGRLLRSCPGC